MKYQIEEGYYWVVYKDFNTPHIVEIRWMTSDHTDDSDRWVIWEGDTLVEREDFFKYNFISKVKEPEWPYETLDIIYGK